VTAEAMHKAAAAAQVVRDMAVVPPVCEGPAGPRGAGDRPALWLTGQLPDGGCTAGNRFANDSNAVAMSASAQKRW